MLTTNFEEKINLKIKSINQSNLEIDKFKQIIDDFEINEISKISWVEYAKKLEIIDNNTSEKLLFIAKLSEEKINHLQLDLDEKINFIEKNIIENEIRIKQIKEELEKLLNEFEIVKEYLNKSNDYWDNLKEDKNNLENNQIPEVNKIIARLENELDELSNKIIKEAELVCATLIKSSYDEKLIELGFDVLIVDELSMVSLPQLYCVSTLIKEKIVLCGDPLQLQPISVNQIRT